MNRNPDVFSKEYDSFNNSEIAEKSKEMLNRFKSLIPLSNEDLKEGDSSNMNIKDKEDTIKNIAEYTSFLKLPGIRRCFEEGIKEAVQKDISYEGFLFNLLEKEYDLRQEQSREIRIRYASFPHKKYLEDISISNLPEDAQKKINLFERWNEIFHDSVMTAAMIDRLNISLLLLI